jgi:hypothetical protein
MNTSLKVVLLSALLYPGAGHFILKKYLTGIALASAFSIPLLSVINEILASANQVVAQVNRGEILADIASISQALSSLMTDANVQEFNVKIYLMAVVWLLGVLDAYRISKLVN